MGARRRAAITTKALGALVAVAIVVVACAGDGANDAEEDAASAPTTAAEAAPTTAAEAAPSGPVADLSEELTGGSGPFIGAAAGADLEAAGYVEEEFVAAGEAVAYGAEGELGEDGRWSFAEDTTAPYRTRVLVRRPADPGAASGTVIVEWLNVSGGVDANPEWASLEEEILRRGHTWVGVSAQLIGVEGGPVLVAAPGAESVAGTGLVGIDPERYGTLEHPGDGYAFDIFSQVARAVRSDGPLLAAGESQSALALVTYHNGVQPLGEVVDGFFVHSRAGVALPLVGPGEYADLAGSIGDAPARLRTDLDVPVMVLQAEGDVTGVLSSVDARQPDSDTVRTWEVAGTAHADAHLLGPLAASADCGAPINDGPLHLVAKAALRALEDWVRSGEAPATFPPLQLTDGDAPAIERDADGIALGGVRTPPVDVPVVVLSGDPGPSDDLFCLLLGSTQPLPAERLAELYPSRADYEERYATAADASIDAGAVLADDRGALLGFSDPDAIERTS